jgi:hypothetical protein
MEKFRSASVASGIENRPVQSKTTKKRERGGRKEGSVPSSDEPSIILPPDSVDLFRVALLEEQLLTGSSIPEPPSPIETSARDVISRRMERYTCDRSGVTGESRERC